MSAALVPRPVGRELAGHWRRLARRRDALAFDWLDSRWQAEFRPLLAPRDRLIPVDIDWGGVPVVARVDTSWIAEVGREVLQVDNLRTIPAVLQPMVVEAAFEGLAVLVEQATRKRFSLLAVGMEVERPAVDGPIHADAAAAGKFAANKVAGAVGPSMAQTCRHGVAFVMDNGDAEVSGELWFDDTGLGYLANALRSLPAASSSDDWGALPATIRFGVGWTVLPLSSLRELQCRDVVMLDESWIGDELDRIVVTVGRMGAAAMVSGRHLTILEDLGAIMEDLDEQELEGGATFGDLPVRLCFDLGERQLTLAELMVMGPGHVFDLGRELRRAVIIRANGKVIGEGELVDVEGKVGVAVLSLAPPERD